MRSTTYAGFRPPREVQVTGQSARDRRLTREQLVDLLAVYASSKDVALHWFSKVYGHDQCNTDRQFEQRHASDVDWRHDNWGARRLTSLLLTGGLECHDWLMLNKNGGSCLALNATNYDALRYNTEVIVTIKFSVPIVDDDLGTDFTELSFAINTTNLIRPQPLLDFLTRSTATSEPLPFGFTYPRYVTTHQGRVGAVLMPRYAISLGRFYSHKLRGQIIMPSQDGQPPFNYDAELMPWCQLRFLLLMWLETALYQAMLPVNYAKGPQVVREAAAILHQMDCLLRNALGHLITRLDACGKLGGRARNHRLNGGVASRELVKRWLLDDARAQFAHYVYNHGSQLNLGYHDGDPFVLLVSIVEQLTKLAYKDRLTPYQTLMKRSQSLPFELLRWKK